MKIQDIEKIAVISATRAALTNLASEVDARDTAGKDLMMHMYCEEHVKLHLLNQQLPYVRDALRAATEHLTAEIRRLGAEE